MTNTFLLETVSGLDFQEPTIVDWVELNFHDNVEDPEEVTWIDQTWAIEDWESKAILYITRSSVDSILAEDAVLAFSVANWSWLPENLATPLMIHLSVKWNKDKVEIVLEGVWWTPDKTEFRKSIDGKNTEITNEERKILVGYYRFMLAKMAANRA